LDEVGMDAVVRYENFAAVLAVLVAAHAHANDAHTLRLGTVTVTDLAMWKYVWACPTTATRC
jgi:hypothetical protein